MVIELIYFKSSSSLIYKSFLIRFINLFILFSSIFIFFSSNFDWWYVKGCKGLSLIIDLACLINSSSVKQLFAFSIFILFLSVHLWGFLVICVISSLLLGSCSFFKFSQLMVLGILQENFLHLYVKVFLIDLSSSLKTYVLSPIWIVPGIPSLL